MAVQQETLLIIMGASGVGKSTLGKRLAETLDWRFIEADDFHDQQAIQKMASGRPLDNQDRLPWLDRIAASLQAQKASSVLAWSGLLKAHRNRFRELDYRVLFVHLTADAQTLRQRLHLREGHFMPASLVSDQLSTLESTVAETDVLQISAELPLDRSHKHTINWLNTKNKTIDS